MRLKLMALAIMTLALSAVLTACDNFAWYTVINETDEELITWALLEDCSVVVTVKQHYLDEEVVKPRERHEYDIIYSPWKPEPKCVQVVTKDRRLVLAEPYEYDGTYTAREPLQPFGGPIPERGDLPSQSFIDLLREAPWQFFVYFAFALLFAAGFVAAAFVGIFHGIRFLYRRYMAKP